MPLSFVSHFKAYASQPRRGSRRPAGFSVAIHIVSSVVSIRAPRSSSLGTSPRIWGRSAASPRTERDYSTRGAESDVGGVTAARQERARCIDAARIRPVSGWGMLCRQARCESGTDPSSSRLQVIHAQQMTPRIRACGCGPPRSKPNGAIPSAQACERRRS